MTIYTDVFTGSSISSPIAYQKITFSNSLSTVQLLWPAQSILTVNSHSATNYYVGSTTNLTSTSLGVRNIYLPDITQQVAGTSFFIVDKTGSGNTVNIYNYSGVLLFEMNNLGLEVCYNFYITDNTIQSGWNYIINNKQKSLLLPYNSVDISTWNASSSSTSKYISFVWATESPVSDVSMQLANNFQIQASEAITKSVIISLPDVSLADNGTTFNLIFEDKLSSSSIIYFIKDFEFTELTQYYVGLPGGYTFFVKDNTKRGINAWGCLGNTIYIC